MKILLADDDATTRKMLGAMLSRWGYATMTAASGDEAWAILNSENAPRLAVLDWVMPGMDGVEICRRVRSELSSSDRYLYLILLTAKTSREEIISGLEAGADDYMVKPFDPSELQVRVGIGKRIIQLHQELVEAKEALHFQATRDPLTRVYNRGATMERLHEELDRSAREGQSMGLIMIDIDHFKKINDTHGHLAGDVVLRRTAEIMTSVVRSYDVVGRFGGEEFLVLLPKVDEEILSRIAERIRAAVAAETIRAEGAEIHVTLSAGTVVGRKGLGVDQLIQAADEALYEAKRSGRNRVCAATLAA
ncbi:response regulator receiver modulated diguanylate cyclase [Desulfacinum hydrothermale DSM 13146]|uniref:diguanylate cyclase n=1 Tax=Desulfacinum hydrothermale DSM 13146 TaxID=1121390 RepID=A0A1W1XPI7_9BACT|nr:diguanylate cyclase [Desulfacinum hydrothermale]SMC25784.1 response regulator receiver modulated diguanylate cyclase [Desulfacinum hydrothermale DSM 13146]